MGLGLGLDRECTQASLLVFKWRVISFCDEYTNK